MSTSAKTALACFGLVCLLSSGVQAQEWDSEPFAKGDMELGVGLGAAGGSGEFYLTLGGSFAYYVIDRLAPGIDVQYTKIFSDYDYPDSLTTLPFAKFVLIRSTTFAPYLIGAAGREFEWGSDFAVDAWILGGGAGAHIGMGPHVAIKLQLLALHYWYDETRVFRYDDDDVVEDEEGNEYICTEPGADPETGDCTAVDDEPDRDSKTFFPLITIGLAFFF